MEQQQGEQAGEMGEQAFGVLLQEAERGQTAAVLAAVDQDNRLLNRANAYGWTLLHHSCQGKGDVELARALLERGADVHAKDSGGRDACWWACGIGKLALVSLLLDKGASPHTRETDDHSCISRAATFDYLPVVLLLISKGADLMEPTYDNRTALALEWWGVLKKGPRLSPAELAARRAEALAAFRAGLHPREVQRRADERWARRWPFMQVAVGHGFRPLAHQQALLAAAALPPSAQIPPLEDPLPALLRDKVFTDDPLFKRIMSYV